MPTKVTIDADGIEQLRKQASAIIKKILADVHSKILDLMREPKTGVVYYRGKKKSIKHQASAPGQAPAVDQGILWNSIKTFQPRPLEGALEIGAGYARFLEEGTRFMQRRPYIEPAFNGVLEKLDQGGLITVFERLDTRGSLL